MLTVGHHAGNAGAAPPMAIVYAKPRAIVEQEVAEARRIEGNRQPETCAERLLIGLCRSRRPA